MPWRPSTKWLLVPYRMVCFGAQKLWCLQQKNGKAFSNTLFTTKWSPPRPHFFHRMVVYTGVNPYHSVKEMAMGVVFAVFSVSQAMQGKNEAKGKIKTRSQPTTKCLNLIAAPYTHTQCGNSTCKPIFVRKDVLEHSEGALLYLHTLSQHPFENWKQILSI